MPSLRQAAILPGVATTRSGDPCKAALCQTDMRRINTQLSYVMGGYPYSARLTATGHSHSCGMAHHGCLGHSGAEMGNCDGRATEGGQSCRLVANLKPETRNPKPETLIMRTKIYRIRHVLSH